MRGQGLAAARPRPPRRGRRWIAAGDTAAAADDVIILRDLAVLRCVHRFKIGDVGAAEASARRVLELNEGAECFAATVAHLLLGVTRFWQGDLAAAQRALGEAARRARRSGNALAETYALGYLGVVAVERGSLEDGGRVVPLALDRSADPEVAEHVVAAIPLVAKAMLLAAGGRAGPAAASSARALALAHRGAGRLELALALTVRAQTAAANGDDGRQWLEQARRLTRGCPDPGVAPVRLARVRLPGRTGTPPVRTAPAAVVLSDRERELLPLLAGTLSQREIGAVLHLSLNTVKTHSRVLFRKLDVASRAEAVTRARELRLL